MQWFNKIKADIAHNREYNTNAWGAFKVTCVFLLMCIFYVGIVRLRDVGPWYLGCANSDGKELLLKTDKKPRVQGSLVFLEDDIFVTPEPGMTCRILTVRKAEKEQELRKGLDNPI